MLTRLQIENYGLIEKAQIEFAAGATIFTGETGSGKTMVLGALAFVLGARADAAAVRRGAEKTIVTLTFDPDEALLEKLGNDGFELDPGEEATIVREMTQAGKSALRLCSRPATAAYVREIAVRIAEIVGQHEAQRLFSPAYHLDLLDRFAGAPALAACDAVAAAYRTLAESREAFEGLRAREHDAAARFEESRFARDEIAGTAPEIGEDDRLNARRRFLDNVERIATALRTANEALAGDDASAVGALGAAGAALDGVANVAENLGEMAAQASALQSEANDLAARVAGALEATEYDPRELERINERLDALDRLKRKYGGTLDAVLARAREAERIVAEYEQREERDAELAAAVETAERELKEAASQLSTLRREAARTFAKRVRGEFAEIALASGSFDVTLEALGEIGRHGAECVEFTFSANKGEELRPLSRIASGGELSRVLLAIVVSLAQARERNALIFDEIDAGIGGATAAAVGARIGRLARDGQVVCITHLAQLATWAHRHYVLEKSERRDVTTIAVREIAGPTERTNEIARMLSGEPRDAALEHAREMLARTVAR
jgi:DNA repair protein RecN (Recombination protein N)